MCGINKTCKGGKSATSHYATLHMTRAPPFSGDRGRRGRGGVSPVLMNRKRFMSAGVFHKIPRIDDSPLAEVFAREVLAMLVRKELLSP